MASKISTAWSGALTDAESFLSNVGTGLSVVYELDPELADSILAYLSKGEEFIGLAQTLSSASASGASKGAALQTVVQIVISFYTGAIKRRALNSKESRDRALSEARSDFFEVIVDNPKLWPWAMKALPHISVNIKGSGWILSANGKYHPLIFKPETIGFRYLFPYPVMPPIGCDANADGIGSVEGTDSADCNGQIVVYPLLYPIWRERSLSTGGELLASSDKEDPGAMMVDLQTRAVLEPEVNFQIPLATLKNTVDKFETEFWAAAGKNTKFRRGDPYGFVGPKPKDGWTEKTQAVRVPVQRGGGLPTWGTSAGICGVLGSPGQTKGGEWATGIKVLSKKPAPNTATLDDRFYLDENGIIHAIWNDADLENCFVLSRGGVFQYDPDTGDRGRCTLRARNIIVANWLNYSTARSFWATRDYVKDDYKAGKFDGLALDPAALKMLKLPTRRKTSAPPGRQTGTPSRRQRASGGGGVVLAAGAGLALLLKLRG